MNPDLKNWKGRLAVVFLAGCIPFLSLAASEKENSPFTGEEKETIHQILEESEEVLAGRGFSYDPAGRRDPFRSLLHGLRNERLGPRPKGIAGMSINEVDLVGIVAKKKSSIAFFNGTDNKGYFLIVGDVLFDGKVMRIDSKEGVVVFRQRVDDSRSIKPYREVTKRLNPVKEEGL